MFTALINLVVDFLFEDILFAPTAASTKEESTWNTKMKKKEDILERTSSIPENETPKTIPNRQNGRMTATSISKLQGRLSFVKSNPDGSLVRATSSNAFELDLETTRVVPSSTQEAHALAVLSMKEIISDRVNEIKQAVNHRELHRQASLSQMKHKFLPGGNLLKNKLNENQKEDQEEDFGVKVKSLFGIGINSNNTSASNSKGKSIRGRSLSLDDAAVEDQFAELTVDIIEQRKHLKRTQQETFDEIWG